MRSVWPANADGGGARGAVGIGFALLIVLFGVDFYFDTRERDVLSWMDPYQYYDFALAVLQGSERFDGFEIPSIFPFFLMPVLAVHASIAASLWVNFAVTLLLLLSVHQLCRELGVRTPSPLVAVLVLSSPLLIGLSRSLYVEYALSALAAFAFLLWLRFASARDAKSGMAFGFVFGLGFMTKMTFPLFLALPIAAAVVERFVARRGREAWTLVWATLVPIAIVLLVQLGLFSGSFGYYTNLGNTTLPIMYLVGPPEWLSWSSATYYFVEVGRTLLFLLTPLLVGAALMSAIRSRELRWSDLVSPTAALWLWLLGPLLLLIAQPVKEPRHVAPCVVPAVLLVVLSIEAIPKRTARAAAMTLALLLAAVQFVWVTRGGLETPYFLDRSLHWKELGDRMVQSGDLSIYGRTPAAVRALHWKYTHNIAIAGFPANEALALTWQAFPGVVFDLDTLDDPQRLSEEIPYARFEDPYIFTAFNTYNRRCGWRWYYEILSREEVIVNADFVIVNETDASDLAARFPEHTLVSSVERERATVRILRNRRPGTVPYRVLYAREFLERNAGLSREDTRVVARELRMAAVLDGDRAEVTKLVREFPFLRQEDVATRNIYWIGGYGTLVELTGRLMQARPLQTGAALP